jgi:hypothetical protein
VSNEDEAMLPVFAILRRMLLTAWIASHSETDTVRLLEQATSDGWKRSDGAARRDDESTVQASAESGTRRKRQQLTHQESPHALWLVVGRSHDLSIYRQILVPHR